MKHLVFVFFVVGAVSAYGGGYSDMKLVNEQEIGVDSAYNIEILYGSEEIILLKSKTDSLVIKEYMNRDNRDYYANIGNFDNKLTIKRGYRPLSWMFRARVEVYLPAQFTRDIAVKISSGEIVVSDEYTFSRVILQASSGRISVNTLTVETADISTSSGNIRCEKIYGNIVVKATSGTIQLGHVEGDVVAETSSGAISGETVNGNVLAKATSGNIKFNNLTRGIEMETTSGSIYCSAAEIVENISLVSTSGRIELRVPAHSIFYFSTRTSSGNLSTPFPEKLFIRVSEKGLVQGVIGEGNPDNNINMETTSGSIVVRWRNT